MDEKTKIIFDRLYAGEEINIRKELACSDEEFDKSLRLYLTEKENENIKQNGLSGYPSVDMPWRQYYSKKSQDLVLPKCSMYDLIFKNNIDYPESIAIEYYGRKITYGEMFKNIIKVVKSFKMMGIKAGDIVSMSFPKTPEAVYSFYALNKIGAIANMIDPRLSPEGIRNSINETDSKYLLLIDIATPKVDKIIDETKLEKIILISPSDSLPLGMKFGYGMKKAYESMHNKSKKTKISHADKYISWQEFIDLGKKYRGEIETEYKKDSAAVIERTGGTTGPAKGAVLSSDGLNALCFQYANTEIFPTIRGDKFLDIMPPFISYGMFGMHMSLTKGMTNVMIPDFSPDKFDKLIAKNKPNYILGVPTYYEDLMKSEILKDMDLSFVKGIGCGGDHMSTDLERRINKYLSKHNCNTTMSKGYGMTELCSAVSVSRDDSNALGSVGPAIVKNNISVIDIETGKELSYYEKGEICVTGPTVMLEYYKNPVETKKVLQKHKDGKIWMHTGDIGYVDENGMLFIVDRLKRLIVRSGWKVFPSEVENVINQHPAVKRCVVVGTNDSIDISVPVAHIILEEECKDYDKDILIREISLAMRRMGLPDYFIPKYYIYKNNYPITSNGKIDYISLSKEKIDKSNPYVFSDYDTLSLKKSY